MILSSHAIDSHLSQCDVRDNELYLKRKSVCDEDERREQRTEDDTICHLSFSDEVFFLNFVI